MDGHTWTACTGTTWTTWTTWDDIWRTTGSVRLRPLPPALQIDCLRRCGGPASSSPSSWWSSPSRRLPPLPRLDPRSGLPTTRVARAETQPTAREVACSVSHRCHALRRESRPSPSWLSPPSPPSSRDPIQPVAGNPAANARKRPRLRSAWSRARRISQRRACRPIGFSWLRHGRAGDSLRCGDADVPMHCRIAHRDRDSCRRDFSHRRPFLEFISFVLCIARRHLHQSATHVRGGEPSCHVCVYGLIDRSRKFDHRRLSPLRPDLTASRLEMLLPIPGREGLAPARLACRSRPHDPPAR
jgi:hypothetical protein